MMPNLPKRNPAMNRPERRGMLLILLVIILSLSTGWLFGQNAGDAAGDQKIRDMKERILEEQEKEKKEKEKKEKEKKEKEKKEKEAKEKKIEGEADENPASAIFGFFFKILFMISFSARFTDYPYADPGIDGFTEFQFGEKEPPTTDEDALKASKWAFLNLSTSFAYLMDNTYGWTSRGEVNILPFHFNVMYQRVFSGNETFQVLSANGGLSLFLPFLTVSGYVGVFTFDFSELTLPGMGVSTQIFLPKHFIFDFYNVNAFYASLGFHYFSMSLNYALSRINLGLGAEISSYADIIYWGPSVRVSIWL